MLRDYTCPICKATIVDALFGPLTPEPLCRGADKEPHRCIQMTRLPGASAVRFKGEGFHANDYPTR